MNRRLTGRSLLLTADCPSGTTLAPLPSTRRGYGIVLNASPKDQKIIYTNGRLVIVRSLAVRREKKKATNTEPEQRSDGLCAGPELRD